MKDKYPLKPDGNFQNPRESNTNANTSSSVGFLEKLTSTLISSRQTNNTHVVDKTTIYFTRGDRSNFEIDVTDTDSIVAHLKKLVKSNKDLNFLNKAPAYTKTLCFRAALQNGGDCEYIGNDAKEKPIIDILNNPSLKFPVIFKICEVDEEISYDDDEGYF